MDPLLKLVLNPPPISTTVNYPGFDNCKLRKLNLIKSKIRNKFGQIENSLKILSAELNLFSHILYKNHNRFRNDKGYKDLRMLEKSLQKFIKHEFLKSLVNFLGFIPDSSTQNIKIFLPTYAMGLHAQLQLYGAGAFLHRLELLSKNSALLDVQRLNLGHFWGVAAQNLGLVGRIWLVCRSLLVEVESSYDGMVKLLAELPKGSSFQEVEMPENLYSFMPEDLVKKIEDESKGVDTTRGPNQNIVSVDDFLDIGEPVKREIKSSLRFDEEEKQVKEKSSELASLNKKRKKSALAKTDCDLSVKAAAKDSLSEIHNLEQLRDFLKSESETRKISRKTSFSRKLNQEKWKLLKKEILSNFSPTKPNKSLKLCRKMLRNAVK